MKNYTKSTSNRINICYSIGKKNQYLFAQRLLESRGLEDIISAKLRDTGNIESNVYFRFNYYNTIILEACGRIARHYCLARRKFSYLHITNWSIFIFIHFFNVLCFRAVNH